MKILLLILLFLQLAVVSCRRGCSSLMEDVTWGFGKKSETRGANFTGCFYANSIYRIRRPENSTQSIRITVNKIEEAKDGSLEIKVVEALEGMAERDAFFRKDLGGVGDTVIGSPFTGFYVVVTAQNAIKPTAYELEFTLEDGGCPYPFLKATESNPAAISFDFLENECDFSVQAEGSGLALELTSVHDNFPPLKHPIALSIFDGFMINLLLHRVDQNEFNTEMNQHLGSSRVAVHITNPLKKRVTGDSFITISAIKDDCRCPNSTILLDSPGSTFDFKLEKKHCFHLNCTTTVTMAESLRQNYRLMIIPRGYMHWGTNGNFSIRDGISEELPIAYSSKDQYVSVHPSVDLAYREANGPNLAYLYVSIFSISQEQQALCNCGHFTSDGRYTDLIFSMDPSCGDLDCVWTFPKTTVYNHSNAPVVILRNSDLSEDDRFILTSPYKDSMDIENMEVGTYYFLIPPGNTTRGYNHSILHYHRSANKNRNTTSNFRLSFSPEYNITDYQRECGCFNETISLNETSHYEYNSPRYPNHYCERLHCRTKFVAPEGYKVVFQIHQVSLQSDRDFLDLYQIIDGKEIRTERYTGKYLQGFATISKTNSLLAVFRSDGSVSYNGFNATVSIDEWEENSAVFEDEVKSRKPLWILSFFFLVLVAVGGVYWRRRKSAVTLSFAPVSYWRESTSNDEDYGGAGMILFGGRS